MLPIPRASLVTQLVKNRPAKWETWVRSLGWEDSPGERKGYPLQYSGLEISMDCIDSLGREESDTPERSALHPGDPTLQAAEALKPPAHNRGEKSKRLWRALPAAP